MNHKINEYLNREDVKKARELNGFNNQIRKGDSIDKWTFGIVTDGKKIDNIMNEIESIVNLKIPHFEIIICGQMEEHDLKSINKKWKIDLEYIHFNPTVAWITKKKNMICADAQYENIVVTHDRFTFDKDWYEGMVKYGNDFEVLCCKKFDAEGKRVGDWVTRGLDLNMEDLRIQLSGFLDYDDWDENIFVDGDFIILKKFVWEKCKWDESLIWQLGEDAILSRDFKNNGVIVRFNPYSTVRTNVVRHTCLRYRYNEKKLGMLLPYPFKLWFQSMVKWIVFKNFGIYLDKATRFPPQTNRSKDGK